jgi:hypothetical protein
MDTDGCCALAAHKPAMIKQTAASIPFRVQALGWKLITDQEEGILNNHNSHRPSI